MIRRDTREALCRCGASTNRAFCDNSHLRASFDDVGVLADGSTVDAPVPGPGTVWLTTLPDGSLLLEGLVELRGGGVRGAPATHPVAPCRCGASARKPLFDGSHGGIGFSAY